MKCLMIETKDKRRFLTHEKHLAQLKEFSKTFNATLSLVSVDDGQILDLKDLVSALCDSTYDAQITNLKLVKICVPSAKPRKKR